MATTEELRAKRPTKTKSTKSVKKRASRAVSRAGTKKPATKPKGPHSTDFIRRIEALLAAFDQQTEKKTLSVAEYIRLLQMKREMDGSDRPKDVKATWIDPAEISATDE